MARSKVYKSKAKAKPFNEELPADDEIDAFDKQKDFVSLDAAKDSDSDALEDEGLYDLSDDADGSSEDEFDSDDSDAEGGTLGRRNSLLPATGHVDFTRSYFLTYNESMCCLLQSSALKKQCATS